MELYKLPIKASFGLNFESGFEFWLLHLGPMIMFLLEILINFNTGYYCEGVIVKDRKMIFKNYLKHMFWVDTINASTLVFVK
jgi:hypothetical protein